MIDKARQGKARRVVCVCVWIESKDKDDTIVNICLRIESRQEPHLYRGDI